MTHRHVSETKGIRQTASGENPRVGGSAYRRIGAINRSFRAFTRHTKPRGRASRPWDNATERRHANTPTRRPASPLLRPRRVHQSQDVAFLGIVGQSMEISDLIQPACTV